MIRCLDCGCDYDAAMALSLLIPKPQWLAIRPEDAGALCANCMLRRASALPGAINITGRITFADEYVEGRPTPYDMISDDAARRAAGCRRIPSKGGRMTPQDRLLQAAEPLTRLDLAATCAALLPTGIRDARGVLMGEVVLASFAMLSTCEIAARRIVEIAYGLPDPELYVVESAPRLLCALINATPQAPDRPLDPSRPSALYRPTLDHPPVVGGLVWYAAANGHSEHVDACVVDLLQTAWLPSPTATVVEDGCITYSAYAGGQPPAQGQPGSWAVRTVARTLTWTGEAWRDDATGRVVMACGDPEALAQMYGGGA